MKIFELDNLGLVSPEKVILEEISLSVEAGEHLTITGPSGSGKSSLLKLLAALVSPQFWADCLSGAGSGRPGPSDLPQRGFLLFPTTSSFWTNGVG